MNICLLFIYCRRLAKSTLVLIPLFGIHYIVFIGVPDTVGPVAQVVKLYFEMFFSSFQVRYQPFSYRGRGVIIFLYGQKYVVVSESTHNSCSKLYKGHAAKERVYRPLGVFLNKIQFSFKGISSATPPNPRVRQCFVPTK